MVISGSKKRPAVVRVQTQTRAEEILDLCNKHGLKVIVGIEPDKPEDVSGVERLLTSNAPVTTGQKQGEMILVHAAVV